MTVKRALMWGLQIGSMLLSSTLLAETAELGRTLRCEAAFADQILSWQVRLIGSGPVAVVDRKETTAEYSSSHVRIPLAAEGHALFIGLVSGRLVVSDMSGITLAKGMCVAAEGSHAAK